MDGEFSLRELNYSESGVDREVREKAKDFSNMFYGLAETPFNSLFKVREGTLACMCVDGVGTKVLLAQLIGNHSGIGRDGAAMVLNDCIRSGAKPIAASDIIDISRSEESIVQELVKGFAKACEEAGAKMVSGETADVKELLDGMHGKTHYQLNCACYGEVEELKAITGRRVRSGDVVIGLRSNGIHSNGISLVRKALFKEWGGAYDPFHKVEGMEKTLIEEVLVPTKIYVKPVLKVMNEAEVKAAVHITGDAYLKFKNISRFSSVGFELNNFRPQKIFSVIMDAVEKTGRSIRVEEMFKTFNMGWGFCLVVSKEDAEKTLSLLSRSGCEAEVIGSANQNKGVIQISWGKNNFSL